jgi:hypothetical protein
LHKRPQYLAALDCKRMNHGVHTRSIAPSKSHQ